MRVTIVVQSRGTDRWDASGRDRAGAASVVVPRLIIDTAVVVIADHASPS